LLPVQLGGKAFGKSLHGKVLPKPNIHKLQATLANNALWWNSCATHEGSGEGYTRLAQS
jgi:hypothetical protein